MLGRPEGLPDMQVCPRVSGDLVLPSITVFIPGTGEPPDDAQGIGEGFEGDMEMRAGEEDLDTFMQESRENSYDMDQGKNMQSGQSQHEASRIPERSWLCFPPPCYPWAGLRDLSEPEGTSMSPPEVQLISSLA